MNRFALQTDESEILLLLENAENLREIAEILGKDVSVISRRLQGISEKTSLILKQERQWRLTSAGRKYNDWTRRMINEQHALINAKERLVLATTKEFSSLVLCPSIAWWTKEFENCEIITTDEGIESLILKGIAHFGFDCGTPYSPQIAFKRGPKEDFVLVYKSKKTIKKIEDLKDLPFYYYNRLDLAMIRNSCQLDFIQPKLSLSDMSSTRSSLLAGEGWSILPHYAVAKEIKEKKLQVLTKGFDFPSMSFGLWWNREEAPQKAVLDKAFEWLSKQTL
jgi:DNA-binding transcriptional LysR family regulator